MTMSDPLVSVVVRTKDRPHLLARALRSIGAQTLSRWECVVVNDGGLVDDVEDVVAALEAAVRTRIRTIHSPTSRGRWRSANAGVLATSGEFVVLHDDDDTWHPDFLRLAATYLNGHPGRDGVVARTEIIWESRSSDGQLRPTRREVFQPNLHDLLLSDALLFNRYVPIGFVYRRSLHEELGLYDESLPVIGDWAFNLRVLQRGSLEFLGPDPLAYWHQRTSGTGADGNSVIEASEQHVRYDALLRDDALRTYASENGLGLALYLTKFIDQRFIDVETAIRRDIAAPRASDRLAALVLEPIRRARRLGRIKQAPRNQR